MTLPRFTSILAVVLVILVGCRPAMVTQENAQGFDYTIVEAGQSYELTMAQMYDLLRGSKLFPKGGIIDAASVSQVVDSILFDSLIGLASKDMVLEDSYEQYRVFKVRYHTSLITEYLEQRVYSRVDLDSLKIVEFYNGRPDLFTIDEQVLISHIVISSDGLVGGADSALYKELGKPEVAAAAKKRILELRGMMDTPESFKDIARQYSHDTQTGAVGGLIGWVGRGIYLEPFDSIAFSMKPGDFSQPYEDFLGWHILYLEDYKPAAIPPLTPESYQLALSAYRQTKGNTIGLQLMDSLLTDVEVEYNESILDSNLYKIDPREWFAVVNGQDTVDCNDARGPELVARRRHHLDNTTPDIKRGMIGEFVQKAVLVQAAKAMSIDTLAELKDMREYFYHKYCKIIYEGTLKESNWMPADSAIERYYEEHKADFMPAKPLTVQHIIVQDSLFGDFLRDQAGSGYDFLDLAEEHYPGDKDVRRELANLGPISEDDVPPAFWQAAKQTVIGEVSYPVKTEFGYHIIKLLSRRDVRNVEQARSTIVRELQNQHAIDDLKDKRQEHYKRFNVKFTGKIVPVHLEPIKMRS